MINYSQSGSLNNMGYNLTTVMKPIGPVFKVKKLRANTPLELELAGTVSATSLSSSNGIRFELRVNGKIPDYKMQGSLKAGHLYDSIVMKSVYTKLKPGTYSVQVYAASAPTGTATNVILDPGGWGEVILATEF